MGAFLSQRPPQALAHFIECFQVGKRSVLLPEMMLKPMALID